MQLRLFRYETSGNGVVSGLRRHRLLNNRKCGLLIDLSVIARASSSLDASAWKDNKDQ